ncbi:MAG TPA: type I-U CRISPR-associated protein Csb2 [Lacunisphaera sp.]|jgi:CRISPR-associated protein Csb2
MPVQLRISVRFLDGTFHGRRDGGESEWPPSPLRLFQSLTNAAARLDGNGIGAQNVAALRWLETLKQQPEIFASTATPTAGYQLYVPDNVGDLVAKKWSKGEYFESNNHPIDISGYRTEKPVCPLRLSGDAAVHYLWPIDASVDVVPHRETLIAMVRAVSCLGWGIDLVVADAAVEESDDGVLPSAERWLPVETSGGAPLRVPAPGTLDALDKRHAAFLGRIRHLDDGNEVFVPVPPLPPTSYRVVTYRCETDLACPPYAVFALRLPDDSGFATFDPLRRRLHLTGMLRYTASQSDFARALGWDKAKVGAFALGHDKREAGNSKPTANSSRLVFIPLPSIEWRGESHGRAVGSIRRVLVTASGGCDPAEFSRIVRALEGRELVDENTKRAVAFLRRQSDNERAISSYLQASSTWTSVTPVVLPGHDDPRKIRHRLRVNGGLTAEEKNALVAKLDQRIDLLLRKALCQAGYAEAITENAAIEWRGSGYLPGTDLASRYMTGDQHHRYRKLHVRIQFRDGGGQPLSVPGPVCFGGGKFSGTGLFAAIS